MIRERYKPVPLDVDAMRKRWGKDAAFAEAFAAPKDEFACRAAGIQRR